MYLLVSSMHETLFSRYDRAELNSISSNFLIIHLIADILAVMLNKTRFLNILLYKTFS